MKNLFKKLGGMFLGLAMLSGVFIDYGLSKNQETKASGETWASKDDTFQLATSIVAGDRIIIVSSYENFAMGAQGDNNRGAGEITKSGSTVQTKTATPKSDNNVALITVGTNVVSGISYFTLGVDGQYLYDASTSKKNYLKTQSSVTSNGYADWTISINSSGIASITARAANASKLVMSYNATSDIFACYSSLQTNGSLEIYKKIEKTVSSIEVTTLPTKTTYYEGDNLDTSGIVVTATYSDSTTGEVTSGCTFSPTTLNTAGTQTITVTHTASTKTTTFDVTVDAARTISSIELNGSLSKTTYYVGDSWDLTGLNIKVIWSSGDPSYVDLDDATSVTTNPTTAESIAINSLAVSVSYQEKQASQNYAVNVLAGPIYQKSMSDWTWTGSASTVYADDIAGTTSPNQHWRLSSGEYFGSSTVTYVLGDYSGSGNGTWSKFSNGRYSTIASSITSANYGFAMYTQDFTVNKLNKAEFSWTTVSGLSGTSYAYIISSTDGGSSWSVLETISALGTNKSITWSGNTFASTDNVIVGFAFTSSTQNGQLRNMSVSLYGDSFGVTTWKVRKIDVTGDSNVEVNSSITLSKTVNNGFEPAANSNVTWSSNDTDIATVDASTGVVTGISTGSVTITASAQDGSNVIGTKDITVVGATIHVSSVSLNKSSLTIEQNGEEQLSATVAPENATDKTVTWSSSNDDVAMVDENGNVLAISAGTATITVTTTDGGYQATCEVTVNAFVGEYELVTSETQLFEGAKILIGAHGSGYSVACGAWNSSSYYDKASADYADDGKTVSSDEAIEFTVYKFGDNFAFGYTVEDSTYFLSSDLTTQSQKENIAEDSAWNVSCSTSTTTMTGKKNSTISFQYNSSSPRFKNYTSSQKAVSLFIKTSEKTATDSQIVDTFINTELHMRDYTESLAYCKDSEHHYYSTAKTKYNSLTAAQKIIFASHSDAYARLCAWATANNETFDSNSNLVSQSTQYSLFVSESGTSTWIIVVVSLTGLTAIGGYFFYKKRKEN